MSFDFQEGQRMFTEYEQNLNSTVEVLKLCAVDNNMSDYMKNMKFM